MSGEKRPFFGVFRPLFVGDYDLTFRCILWQWLKLIPWAIYMLLVFSVLPDSYTSLHPTFSRRGRLEVRFGKEVSVEDLKVVSRATGAKINDVILALLAGAARRYLLAEVRALYS